jgi:tellurite resistance protein
MFRTVRRLPLFKLIAVVQLALLARRHLGALTPAERRRMAELARRGHRLTAAERTELRALAMKLEPRAFAAAAADRMSPFPLPRRLLAGRRRV